MTNSDKIKCDIDQMFSDKTVTKATALARLKDIVGHIEMLIDSLVMDDEEDEDGGYKDWDDEDD